MDYVEVYVDSLVTVYRVFRDGEFLFNKTVYRNSDGMICSVVCAYPDGHISTDFYC